jgi:hypothetical protein
MSAQDCEIVSEALAGWISVGHLFHPVDQINITVFAPSTGLSSITLVRGHWLTAAEHSPAQETLPSTPKAAASKKRKRGPSITPEPTASTNARIYMADFVKRHKALVMQGPLSLQSNDDPTDLERLGNLYVDIAKEIELGGFEMVARDLVEWFGVDGIDIEPNVARKEGDPISMPVAYKLALKVMGMPGKEVPIYESEVQNLLNFEDWYRALQDQNAEGTVEQGRHIDPPVLKRVKRKPT